MPFLVRNEENETFSKKSGEKLRGGQVGNPERNSPGIPLAKILEIPKGLPRAFPGHSLGIPLGFPRASPGNFLMNPSGIPGN